MGALEGPMKRTEVARVQVELRLGGGRGTGGRHLGGSGVSNLEGREGFIR